MELVSLGEKTYYIKNATNIGVYKVNDQDVYLIDTGGDKDAGKKILKMMEHEGWCVKGIINTHSHADHIGGNQVIQNRTGAIIYGEGIEKCFVEYPILESSLLGGGYPIKNLKNKFLCASASIVDGDVQMLPEGLEIFSLKGHSPEMIGLKTSDDVYFLGDALLGPETISKYHLFYIYDVRNFIETLEKLKSLKGKFFVPSHVEAMEDITNLIEENRKQVQDIIETILDICQIGRTFEEILQKIFEHYDLVMNVNQYALIGSTLRSYLGYLYEEDLLEFTFSDYQMKWKVTDHKKICE